MEKKNKTISRQLKSAFAAWAAGLYIIGTGATAYALPEGGQVAAGQAAITTAGSTMTIAQQTAQAIINWQNFGIGSGEAVHINQPNSQAMLLNRVVGSNPSEIFGQLTANGQVILVNPNGVFFRPGSSVDVGGLTASTLNIANEDFLKGQLRFAGDSQNPVINAGNITAQNGYVNLLAKEVVNEGIIAAQTGSVNLAAGSGMSLDYNGDGKMTVAVTDGAYQSAVANKKLIQADGGLVVMTASGKDALMDSAVNNSGMIQANTLGEATGQISLTGDNIATTGTISADGGSNGHGGTIKIIANHKTAVDGQLSAQGGQLAGDGGFIETSGDVVRIGDHSSIQANAPQGKAGQWLIDPVDITISDDGTDESENGTNIRTSFITDTLGKGSHVILDTHKDGNKEGTITVNGAINVQDYSRATLTLNANKAININADISFTGESQPNLTLITTEDNSSINNRANINIGNGTLNITTGKNGVLNAGSIGADTVNITAHTIKQAEGVTVSPLTIKNLNLRQANPDKSIYIGNTASSSTGAESMAEASLFAPGGVFSKVENLKLIAGRNQDIQLKDVDFQNANITGYQNLHSRRTLNIAGNVSTKGSLLVNTEKFNVADNARLISSGLKLMTRNNSDTNDEVSTIRAGSNAKIISTNNEAFTYYPDNSSLSIVNSPNLTEDHSINYDFLNALEGFSKYEVGNNHDFLMMKGGQLNKSITFKGNNIYLQFGSIQMQGKGTLNLIAGYEIGLVDIKLNMGEGNLNMMAQNLNVSDSQVSGTGNLYLNTADTSGSAKIILGSTGGNRYDLYIKPEYFRSGGLFSNLTGRVYIGLLPGDNAQPTNAPIHLTSSTDIKNELYLATQKDIQGFDGSTLNTNYNNLYLNSQGGNIDLSKTALYNTPIKQAWAAGSVKLNNTRNELGPVTNVIGPNGVEIYSNGTITTGRQSDSGISASNGDITIRSGSSSVVLDKYANLTANKVLIFAQDRDKGAFKNYADNPFPYGTKWGIATYDALKDDYGNLTGDFRQYGKIYTDKLEPLMAKGNGSIHVNRPIVKIVSERVYGQDSQAWLTQNGTVNSKLQTYILNDQGEIDTSLTQKYLQADNKFLNKNNTFLLEGVADAGNYTFGYDTNYVNKNIGGTGRDGTAYGSANPDADQQVKFNKASDQNYKVQTEFWVTPAPLEVSTKDLNIVYNGLNSATDNYKDQLSFTGLVNNESISKDDIYSFDLDYIKADGQSNKGPLHAGTYGIRCDNLKLQAGNHTLDNYIITYKDGTLVVKPKEVKVALASPSISKTYDGQASVSQNDFTYNGFVQGESLAAGNVLNFAGTNDLAIIQDGQPAKGIDVGSYQVKIGNIGVTASDYTFVADANSSATLQITPHLVTLKANDDSIVKNDKPYEAGTKGFSYLTGFVGNDTAESLGLSTSALNFGNKAGTTDGADGATLEGKYNIYLDGSWSSKNYKFAYEPGQLIININNPTPPVEALESMQAVQSNTSNNAVTANMPNTTGDMPNATSDSTIAPALPGNLPQSAGETTKLEGLPVFIDNNLIQAKDFDTIFAHEELGTFLIQIRDGQMSISPLNQKAVEVLASADPAIRQQLEESIEEHLKDTQS